MTARYKPPSRRTGLPAGEDPGDANFMVESEAARRNARPKRVPENRPPSRARARTSGRSRTDD